MQPISPVASIAYFNSPEPDRPKYATFCSRRPALALVLAVMVIIARPAMGQVMPSPSQTATNAAPALAVPETAIATQPQDARALAQKAEEIRAVCIDGRRR